MNNLSTRISKILFIGSLATTFLTAAFLYGVVAQQKNLPPVPQFHSVKRLVRDLPEQNSVSSHLQPNRGQGSGVVTSKTHDDNALIFLSGFFDNENQARLIKRDGTVVKKWSLRYSEHFADAEERVCKLSNDLRVDTHGALVTPQGELVFNYEYCGTVKLDQCGAVMWSVNKRTHHSLVKAQAGGYWLLGQNNWETREYPDRFMPFSHPDRAKSVQEDMLLRMTDEGEIVDEISIPVLIREAGYGALLTTNGKFFTRTDSGRAKIVHANKITELSAEKAEAFPLFSPGDLAISMRNLNLVIVIDPVTKAIKWHQTGPWLRQHDPEFRADGRISIFNNNVYRTHYQHNSHVDLTLPWKSNIIAIDPVTRQTEVLFGQKPGQEMLSVIRGQHELLEDGGMLIVEFDAGRVLEVNAGGEIVWEYVNEYNDEFVGEVTNAAVYPAGYFNVELSTCG